MFIIEVRIGRIILKFFSKFLIGDVKKSNVIAHTHTLTSSHYS